METEIKPLKDAPTSLVARFFGVSAPVVLQLADAGIIPRRERNSYDLEACCRAYCEHLREGQKEGRSERYVDERTRLTKAKADAAEMTRKRLLGETVEVSTLKAAWGAILSVVRTRLLAIPSRCAPRGAGKSANELARILREDVNGILTYLEKTKVAASDLAAPASGAGNGHSRTNGRDGTAARPDLESVG